MLLKYGISNRFELRAELTGKSERQFSTKEFHYGLQPVELGFKAMLSDQKGALPATSFYTGGQKEYVLPELRLLFENKLPGKVKLGYNVGARWQGEETVPQWLYSITPEIELG